MNRLRLHLALIPLALLSLPAQAPVPQDLRIDHFVQRGQDFEPALAWRETNAMRICCGGAAEAFAGKVTPYETLSLWLSGTDVIAACGTDLPFWSDCATGYLPLCATNVRDRDGLPVGSPFLIKAAGPVRLCVMAVITGTAPAGFTTSDAVVAVQAALAAAKRDSDAALVVSVQPGAAIHPSISWSNRGGPERIWKTSAVTRTGRFDVLIACQGKQSLLADQAW